MCTEQLMDHEPSKHLLGSCLGCRGVGAGVGAVCFVLWVPSGTAPSRGTVSQCHNLALLCMDAHIMLQDPICLVGQNCRCKTHCPNIHRSNVFSMQEACSWGEDVRGDAESHSANMRPDRLSLHSEGKDPRNTESKSHSYCLLAAIKLLSNACATVSLYATHRFCF